MITQKELKEVMRYCPETGEFTWLVDSGRRYVSGLVAGGVNGEGYVLVQVEGVQYRAHRLAFLYMNGEWPTEQIDHINKIKNDNRWSNLRSATIQQNQANVGLRSDNTSGYKGLSWNAARKYWVVQVRGEGGTHVSYHKCKEKAIEVLYRLQKIIHGEFANSQKL